VSSLRFVPGRGLAPLALLTALAAAAPAGATVAVEVPLEQQVAEADAIVLGSVESTGHRLEARGGRLVPVTLTRVRVLRWLKGGAGPSVELRTPGGRHPRGERRVVGAPRFAPGEQVLLFLRRSPDGFVPAGLSLGVYRVERGRGPAPARLARHEDGLVVASRRGDALVLAEPDDGAPVSLATFLARVEALVARQRGEGP